MPTKPLALLRRELTFVTDAALREDLECVVDGIRYGIETEDLTLAGRVADTFIRVVTNIPRTLGRESMKLLLRALMTDLQEYEIQVTAIGAIKEGFDCRRGGENHGRCVAVDGFCQPYDDGCGGVSWDDPGTLDIYRPWDLYPRNR